MSSSVFDWEVKLSGIRQSKIIKGPGLVGIGGHKLNIKQDLLGLGVLVFDFVIRAAISSHHLDSWQDMYKFNCTSW